MIWRIPVSLGLTLIGRRLIRYDDLVPGITILGTCAGALGMWLIVAAFVVIWRGFQ